MLLCHKASFCNDSKRRFRSLITTATCFIAFRASSHGNRSRCLSLKVTFAYNNTRIRQLPSRFKQFGQLQWISTDALHWSQQKSVQWQIGQVAQETTALEELVVLNLSLKIAQFGAGQWTIVAIVRVHFEALLLKCFHII